MLGRIYSTEENIIDIINGYHDKAGVEKKKQVTNVYITESQPQKEMKGKENKQIN